jgi:8-oxo-dGTP pyrophosphatase MutT (NUDIX family)
MTYRPVVTVAAVAEQQGRFLLVEEHIGGRLLLNQPAGHLEEGESPESAVAREALEESGWHFEPTALVGIYLWRHAPTRVTYLRLAFAGELRTHDPARPLDDGVVRTVWLDRNGLAEAGVRLRSPLVLRCVDDWLAGRRHPLTLLHTLIDAP